MNKAEILVIDAKYRCAGCWKLLHSNQYSVAGSIHSKKRLLIIGVPIILDLILLDIGLPDKVGTRSFAGAEAMVYKSGNYLSVTAREEEIGKLSIMVPMII
ncbi:MAG: hypothetical protein IPK31_20640 [Chitinophagaceae bacterium]|nr:hypothetical protein [Chitinophagaceae bacterium]